MRFDRLTPESGLSQSSVVTILQDSQGFMWFGTENGLNRYDGYEFEQFRRERGNPVALHNDFIYDLAEAPAHRGDCTKMERLLRDLVDPEEVDRRAKADQAARIAAAGGREAVRRKGSFGYTPAPGEAVVYK